PSLPARTFDNHSVLPADTGFAARGLRSALAVRAGAGATVRASLRERRWCVPLLLSRMTRRRLLAPLPAGEGGAAAPGEGRGLPSIDLCVGWFRARSRAFRAALRAPRVTFSCLAKRK